VGGSHAYALAVAPDGATLFVTGESLKREMFDYDFATVAYAAATGEQLWVARAGKGGSDGAASVAVSPDGTTTYVTGHVDVNGWNDYYTIAYQT